ncbi:MAG: hypothetical protein COC05_02895 [Gammaproteobacteria bacterium]|nr:MAG: hypothetical protein COC05_02895 [Gammaproteobacteria bacterium]
MKKISHKDLLSLEEYSKKRDEIRANAMVHKAKRRLNIGDNAFLYFEDYTTMHYQVQEMLRIERIFDAAEIEQELDTYNPLIPDGSNWKATFMLQYDDIPTRRVELGKLLDIEDKIWVEVEGCGRIFGIANEDLDRKDPEKTSSVHFMRFELPKDTALAAKAGAVIKFGIDHDNYRHEVIVPDNVRNSLKEDLD